MQSTLFPLLKSDAVFSPDRLHRYGLWRIWDDDLPKVLFIGLNPSTADELKNDPTIRRCIGYAKDWGYGCLLYTSPSPRDATLSRMPSSA